MSRTRLSDFTFTFYFHALEKEMATQCSCLENPRDGGASWAAVYGVAQSRTRLKWLSSSSSSFCTGVLTTNVLATWRLFSLNTLRGLTQFFSSFPWIIVIFLYFNTLLTLYNIAQLIKSKHKIKQSTASPKCPSILCEKNLIQIDTPVSINSHLSFYSIHIHSNKDFLKVSYSRSEVIFSH